MIDRIKLLALAIVFAILGSWLVLNGPSREKFPAQVVLAGELQKAMNAMMADLSKAKTASIQGVPADGRWHDSIGFSTTGGNSLRYDLSGTQPKILIRSNGGAQRPIAKHLEGLRLRRSVKDESIIEVRIVTRLAALSSNFRIRMQP